MTINKKKFGSLLLALAGIAGGLVAKNNIGGHKAGPPAAPPPIVQPAKVGYLAVWVEDEAEHRIEGAEVHVSPDVLGMPGTTNDGGWAGAPATFGDYEVRVTAAGYVSAHETVAVATDAQNTDLHVTLAREIVPALQARVDGRFWVTDAGTFRPIFQSGLTLLVRGPPERAAFLDATRALGFNGVRVFAGDIGWAGQTPAAARAALPALLEEAAARGLYVYVSALQGGGYDVEAHLREVAAIVAAHPNAMLEVANEIGHASQSDLGKDPSRLLQIARHVIPPGVLWSLGAFINSQGNTVDEVDSEDRYPTDGGSFNDAHLDRGRDLYNQVRRLREIAGVSQATRKPAMSGEPIGIAEGPSSKQRFWGDDALRFSFASGVLCRGFELGCVWHSEDGLNAQPLGPNTRASAEAFVAGWRSLPTDGRLTFVNAGWPGSPVSKANFDTGIVRAYSFTEGGRGWTVLVGVRGDPAVEWGGGWHPVGVVAERPGVQVIEIGR